MTNEVITDNVNYKRAAVNINVKQGHKLVSINSNNKTIYKCVVCGGFILSGGLHCAECKYACHNKCSDKIRNRCINDFNEEQDSIDNSIIPHKFKSSTSLTPNWCCHCGLMLPNGKNEISKCTECGKCYHHECEALISNQCGMAKSK